MTRRLHVGRMARWQRWTSYLVLGACATTGFVWFLALDWWHVAPPVARPWWVLHGVTAVLAAAVIGGALSQHVVVAWRASRARWAGGINVALLASLVATALYLMYGAEWGHEAAHWIHALVGIGAAGAFVGHVLWGRTRIPKLPPHARHATARKPSH